MKPKNKQPPVWADRFLQWFCKPELLEEIHGDLLEIFNKNVENGDLVKAKLNYSWNVFRSFRISTIRSIPMRRGWMLRYHLGLAFRQIVLKKSVFGLKLGGLILGFIPFFICTLFTRYESSFDHHQPYADRTYRVVQHTQFPDEVVYWNTTAYPLADAIRKDFSSLEHVTQTAGPVQRILAIQNPNTTPTKFIEDRVLYVDTSFHNVFDLSWIEGSPNAAFRYPNSIILTRSTAEKYATGSPQAIMESTIFIHDSVPMKITGIIEDPLPQTNVKFDLLIPYAFFKRQHEYWANNWSGNYEGTTYLVLQDPDDDQKVEAAIAGWKKKYLTPEDNRRISYYLQPLKEIHNEKRYGAGPGSYVMSKQTLNVVWLAGLFILCIALVNFINLVTARSTLRFKEVGIRKIIGGTRINLIRQFLIENGLFVFLALALTAISIRFFTEPINRYLTSIDLQLDWDMRDLVYVGVIGLGLALFTGIYPAIVMSSFQPLKVLKNQMGMQGRSTLSLRKSLMVFQFILVQIIVISSVIALFQINAFRQSNLGFDSAAVITTPAPDLDKLDAFRNSLSQHTTIEEIAFGSGPPMAVEGLSLGTVFRLPNEAVEAGRDAEIKIAGPNYVDFYDLELVSGRTFHNNKAAFDEFIVNEKLLQSLNWTAEEAIGKKLAINEGEATIVGVLKDFHNHSLQNEITPCVFVNWIYFKNQAFIKTSEVSSTTLKTIESTWNDVFTSSAFSYTFLEESIAQEYFTENLLSTGLQIISLIVVALVCLGIFGLISFITMRRLKEIGIRKVLGATVLQIVHEFSKEFIILLLVAFLISIPIVYVAAEAWLQNFSYPVKISVSMFLIGGVSIITMVMITSSAQIVRAALTRPADCLHEQG